MDKIKNDDLVHETVDYEGAIYTWTEYRANGDLTGNKTLAIIENGVRHQLDFIEPTEENLEKFKIIINEVNSRCETSLSVDQFGFIVEIVNIQAEEAQDQNGTKIFKTGLKRATKD